MDFFLGVQLHFTIDHYIIWSVHETRDLSIFGQLFTSSIIVRSWFIAQFPLYRKEPLFYLTGEHMVLSASDFLKKQEAMKQSA